jgi:hypothetical protein
LTPLVLNVRNHAQNNNYKMSEIESNLDNEEIGKPILIWPVLEAGFSNAVTG